MLMLLAASAMAMNGDPFARTEVPNRMIMRDGGRAPVVPTPLECALYARTAALQGNTMHSSMPFWGAAAPQRLLPLPSHTSQTLSSQSGRTAPLPSNDLPVSSLPHAIPVGEIAMPIPLSYVAMPISSQMPPPLPFLAMERELHLCREEKKTLTGQINKSTEIIEDLRKQLAVMMAGRFLKDQKIQQLEEQNEKLLKALSGKPKKRKRNAQEDVVSL